MRVRVVEPGDAAALSRVAARSKAHWGYDDEFMGLARDELTWVDGDLAGPGPFGEAAEVDGSVVGFYLLEWDNADEPELDALYVDPPWIGKGLGRLLLTRAVDQVRQRGARSLLIQSDPNAEPFYRIMGAVPVGASPSGSIPGRWLPLLRLTL